MIQKFEDINEFGEYPDEKIIEEFFDFVLKKSTDEPLMVTLDKLVELGDKQWHNYEEPKSKFKEKIKSFLVSKWSNESDFLEKVLIISYDFALDKSFYQTALNSYKGESYEEFAKDLANSSDDNIDPYWTMRK